MPITGNGGANVTVDVETSVPARFGTTAFNESKVANAESVIQIDSSYGIIPAIHETFSASGGTATVNDGQFVVTTSATPGSYGVIRSLRSLRYRPGRAVLARYSARFSSGVALSQQLTGLFGVEQGIFIGYNGSQFGVCRQNGGKVAIRRLTINTPAAGAENVTVTLNDVAFGPIAVSSTVAATNAATIAAYAGFAAGGWSAYQIGNTVTFVSATVGAKAGTYSLVSTGACAGTFATLQAGVAHTEYWTYQDDFNGDKVNGEGASGMTLVPSNGNVFEIEYKFGFGNIVFRVFDPDQGDFIVMNTIKYANANTAISLDNPNLKIGWVVYSLGTTTPLTVAGASASGLVFGSTKSLRQPLSQNFTRTGIGTTLTNVISIRNGAVFNNRLNLVEILVDIASVAVDGTKNAILEVRLNPTFSGTQNWQSYDSSNSSVEYDTTNVTVSGGTLIYSFPMGKVNSDFFPFD